MSDLILHHYANSPFAEKIRTLLGHKNVCYNVVNIPVIMPKPDLVALTGGFRKTPVLQQQNHIYCDTRLMARLIDQQFTQDSIFPDELDFTANILAQWADQHLFSVAAALAFSPAGFTAFREAVPEKFVAAFVADRAKLREGGNGLSMDANTALQSIPIYLQQLEKQLDLAGPYICGEQISIADFSIYHCLWFINNNAGVRYLLENHPKLNQWFATIQAIGHGTQTPIDATDAIDIARSAPTEQFSQDEFIVVNGFTFGEPVAVAANDYGIDPVVGELLVSKQDEVVIKRIDERAGELYVHFPRVGYKISALT
ncbi:glutathione S-transferase family protein [uncultured Paraglaciecola sp.]|uniref:glutathione S-transferase family protein n=1 Tax=uncultured Paraglaciecola sp. TaxID=1765024 RepID=UPI002621A0A7|nr:glutathione S-transferase family protein [uncultured Paraglaciecola sp.]